jgi:ferredoxin
MSDNASIKDKIVEEVADLFEKGRIDAFIGLKKTGGHIGPHLFQSPEELADLSLGDQEKPGDARYPLAGFAKKLVEADPSSTFGVLVRSCDEAALYVLMNESRVTPLPKKRVVPVGFSCPPELAAECECVKPTPDALVAGDFTPGAPAPTDEYTGEDMFEQLQFWYETMNRCLKCFGCRNVCPVCACHECTIEQEEMVPQRELPPSPNFLMTRAMHMVDRCVYCGLCENACPADIPLKALYRFVAKAVGQNAMIPGATAASTRPVDLFGAGRS